MPAMEAVYLNCGTLLPKENVGVKNTKSGARRFSRTAALRGNRPTGSARRHCRWNWRRRRRRSPSATASSGPGRARCAAGRRRSPHSRAPSRAGKTCGPRARPRRTASAPEQRWQPRQGVARPRSRSRPAPGRNPGNRQKRGQQHHFSNSIFQRSSPFSFGEGLTDSFISAELESRAAHLVTNSGARPWDHGSYVCANRMRSSSGG